MTDARVVRAHRNRRRALSAVLVVVAIVLPTTTAASCGGSSKPSASSAQNTQNQLSGTTAKEFQDAVPYPFSNSAPSDPLERKNLAARLKQLNSEGATGYVYLMAPNTDKVIGYYVTRGKVSSTGSQMTSTDINVNCNGNSSCTDRAIGDDGSYGPDEGGEQGVFFFTATGVLIETVFPWIWSAQPISIYSSVPQLDK